MSDSPLIQASKHADRIKVRLAGIDCIADALTTLGMPAGDELRRICNEIWEEADDCKTAIHESIHDSFHRTQQATNNMVGAALSAIRQSQEDQ